MSWSNKSISTYETALTAKLDQLFKQDEVQGRLAQIIRDLNSLSAQMSDAQKFVHCLAALKLDADLALLSKNDSYDLMRMAESLLHSNKADQKNSRLSHLMGELYEIRSQISCHNGDHFLASWQAAMADLATHRAPANKDIKHIKSQARRLLRLGHPRHALSAFKVAIEANPEDLDSKIGLIECLQISGALDDAMTEAHSHINAHNDASLSWLSAVLDLQKTKDYQKFSRWVADSTSDPEKILLAKLWLFTGKQRILDSTLPKVDTIRRKLDRKQINARNMAPLLRATKVLEQCHDVSLPLRMRLDDLGDALSDRNNLPHAICELLFLAGAERMLRKYSQTNMLEIVSSEYESVSLRLSRGSSKDVLNVMTDPFALHNHNSPPHRQFARAGQIALMAIRGAGIVASNRSRRIFASEIDASKLREEEMENISNLLAETFGRLKGGMMKVGQVLSLMSDISPRFANPLRRMNLAAEASDNRQIEQIIIEDLGDKPQNIFEEWNEDPIAIGSVGQVYKARLKSGELVAVKVQHPGVAESLQSDLKLLRVIKPIIRRLFPAANSTEIFNEIHSMLLSELDYLREAKNQQRFAEIFAGHAEIIVPEVFEKYSGKKVITSKFIEGLSFESFLKNSSQEDRDSAGQNIVKAFLYSIWPHGHFNCDPHPNNYVFLEDGKIALLDFGSVKLWNEGFVDAWGNIILSAIAGDASDCLKAWIATKAYRDDQPIDKEMLLRLSRTMCEPLLQDKAYQFDHSFVRRNADSMYLANTKLKKFFAPPPESTMMMRFAWGLYSVLADLGATDNWRKLVHEHLSKVAGSRSQTIEIDRAG